MLSGYVNHALQLPAAIAVTALLPTYNPLVHNPLQPVGRVSDPFIHLFSPNDGLLSDPACITRLTAQLYLSS